MTLPLKLVPFERFAAKDFPNAMAYTIRLKFSGELDREALRAAIGQAVERHPLLRANLTERDGEPHWTRAPQPMPWTDFAAAGEPMRFPREERIDLHRETGLRVWVRGESGDVEMRFQYHHACCDGVGAYTFLEDVFCCYDRLVRAGTADLPELPPLEPALLARRDGFGLSRWTRMLRLPLDVVGFLVGMGCYLIVRPARVHSPEPPQLDETQRRTQADLPADTLSAEELAALREAAREYRATLNDLLLREAFYTLAQWNLQHGARPRIMRITLPMNLRLPGDEQMPAANVVGMTLLDRSPHWYRKPHKLLKSMRFEMSIQKRFRFPLTFVRFCSSRFCVGVITNPNRAAATAVLSNMGRVFQHVPLRRRHDGKLLAGELVLESVESAPPILPQIDVSLSALSYAGRLAIVLNYDRNLFTRDAACELHALYVDRLRKIAHAIEKPPGETVADAEPSAGLNPETAAPDKQESIGKRNGSLASGRNLTALS